jgi:hypothetical protein
MPRFNVTFEIVTPESAANGEAEKIGYAAKDVRLREAFTECGHYLFEDAGRWFSNPEYGHGTRDYFAHGREETRSLHPPENITPSSYQRLRKLFEIR